jgi:hypothetical protein
VRTDRAAAEGLRDRHREDAPAAVDLGRTAGGAVDVPLVPDAPLPVVEATIGGHGPFRFGVETGAQFAGVRRGIADELGLEQLDETIGMRRFRAPSVGVGGATFTGVPLMEIRTAATDIDGILGFPFWRDLAVTIDYPAGRLRLTRDHRGDGPGLAVPIVPVKDGDFLGVPIRIGDRALTGLVDTRSMGAIGLTPEDAAGIDFEGELQVVGIARGAAIPETEVRGGRLAHDLVLAGHRVVRPFASVRPLPEHFPTEPVLGNALLRHFRLTIDVASGWMRFDRDTDEPLELPPPARRPLRRRAQRPPTP